MFKEFSKFLKEYKVGSLAVAFIIGEASSNLVSSLVKDVFMPIIQPLTAAESWRLAAFDIGPIHIAYGTLLADVLNFILVAFLVFIVAKKIINEDDKKK